MSDDPLRVLVFHHAAGFVHFSIPAAVAVIVELGAERGWHVDTTDDPDVFRRLVGGAYDTVVFVQTSGDVLPEPEQRRALERHVADGGGFFGIHAASSMGDVAADWPWFRDLVGASFKGHTIANIYADEPVADRRGARWAGPFADSPPDADRWSDELAVWSCEPATVRVEEPGCPAIDGVADGDVLIDEWYGFHENPRPHVRVVATVDESTYDAYLGEMGDDHPIVWWREYGGGRSVYNSMGHSVATWNDPRFRATVVGGILLAADRA
jgi:type 1 glutamine amidotransferase